MGFCLFVEVLWFPPLDTRGQAGKGAAQSLSERAHRGHGGLTAITSHLSGLLHSCVSAHPDQGEDIIQHELQRHPWLGFLHSLQRKEDTLLVTGGSHHPTQTRLGSIRPRTLVSPFPAGPTGLAHAMHSVNSPGRKRERRPRAPSEGEMPCQPQVRTSGRLTG